MNSYDWILLISIFLVCIAPVVYMIGVAVQHIREWERLIDKQYNNRKQ